MRASHVLEKWGQILILVFLVGAFFHIPWLVAFSSSVAVVYICAHYWRNYSLKNVHYNRKLRYRRGFPGETIKVETEVANRKFLPLSWLRASDDWPMAVATEDETLMSPSHISDQRILVTLYSLRWFDIVRRSFTLKLRQRGIYPLGPVVLESGDPFGIFDTRRMETKQELLTVFPEIYPLEFFKLPTQDPFGENRAQRQLFVDPAQIMGVRAYHPEDDFRQIHWAATARTGTLQTRVYQPVSAKEMMVCLNVITSEQSWMGSYEGMLEMLVKTAASLVYHGFQQNYAVGLVSNGCLAHADRPFHILPSRSHDQLATLLTALAGVTQFMTAPFENYLTHISSRLPYGSVLFIVTAVLTPSIAQAVQQLSKYHKHTTLICMAEESPPPLQGVRIIHLPFTNQSERTQG